MALSLDDPRSLIDCSPDALRELVRAVPAWSEPLARQLDQVLRSRVVEALAGSADSDALSALQAAMQAMLPRARQAEVRGLDRDWWARWSAWADLLDTRLAQLQARDPERVRHLRHVPQLLQALEELDGPSQAELGERLGLSAPNLSRLLRTLEDHELVERRADGQAKRVYLKGQLQPIREGWGQKVWGAA